MNAKMLKENTMDTTKLLENSSISFEVLQKSFDDILASLEIQSESTLRVIEAKKEYMKKMEDLNNKIERKIMH